MRLFASRTCRVTRIIAASTLLACAAFAPGATIRDCIAGVQAHKPPEGAVAGARRQLAALEEFLRRADLANGDSGIDHGDIEPQIDRGDLILDPARHVCTWKGQRVTLTVTEFLILKSLAQRPGHVKSRDQLLDAAYDDNIYVDDRTIDSHIKRIRKKFRMTDPEFSQIETLYGVGYRFKET